MDSTYKDNLSSEKLKSDGTELSEIEGTNTSQEEKTVLDTPLHSPEKRKSKSCFEIKPERSIDNVEQESAENLAVHPNIQVSVTDISKKYEKHQTTVTFPDNKNETIKEGINREDQFTIYGKNIKTSKESDSATHESSVSESSNVFDQSKSNSSKTENITESGRFEMDGSCKDETKITETLAEKRVTEPSKLEVEETFSKCQEVTLDTPISSPVKRKSQQMAEDEIKRKRSADNVLTESKNEEIITEVSNEQNDALCVGPSGKLQHLASTMVIIDNKKGDDIGQDLSINQTDQSAIKCETTKTADETNSADTISSEDSNIYKSREHIPSGEEQSHQEEITTGTQPRSPVSMPLEDLENNHESVQKQILESTSHQRQSLTGMKTESDDDKRNRPKSSKSKDPKIKMDSSDKDNLSEDKLERDKKEHPKAEETKTCPEKELMLDTSVRSPVKRKSESCFEIKSKRSTDDVREESDKNLAEVDPEVSIEDHEAEVSYKELQMIEIVENTMKEEGKDITEISPEEFYERRSDLNKVVQQNPDLLIDYPENEQTEEIYERSVHEMGETNQGAPTPVTLEDSSADTLPLTLNPNESSASSSTEKQSAKISETDSPVMKEYPDLDENISKGVKDTRYLKKHYKQKNPVMLPTNWSGDETPSSKIEANIYSEEDQIQIIGDDPRSVSRSCEDISPESENKIILKNEDLLKERQTAEDKLSETSASASKNKCSSQAEISVEVKKDERHEKECGKQKSESLNIYAHKIQKTDVESIESNSPNRNNESKHQYMLEGIEFEGLAARIMPPAGPSRPPTSPAGPSRPPTSPAGPSRPPTSPAGPSRPPTSPAGPSRPPTSPAGPSPRKK